jgi:hypothetical protein
LLRIKLHSTMWQNRLHPRTPVLKTGKIAIAQTPENAGDIIDCAVFDLSAGGACILVSNPAQIPDVFQMSVGPNDVYTCRVVWRALKRIGVSFQVTTGSGQPFG